MTRHFRLLIALMCCWCGTLSAQPWDGTTAKAYAGGDGTEASPYLIANASQLAKLARDVNITKGFSKGKFFKLTADIVLNEKVYSTIVRATRQDKEDLPANNDVSMFRIITRIGTYLSDTQYNPFEGTFDGDGHVISGLTSQLYSSSSCDGLFRVIEGAHIKNVGLTDCYMLSNSYVSGLVGKMIDSRVTNCFITHSYIEGGGPYTGALIGWCMGNSQVKNCYAEATTFGSTDMGGLIGRIGDDKENSCVVENCFSMVEVRVKRRNNGAISAALSPGSIVRHCFFCKLGEATHGIWPDYQKGTIDGLQDMTEEQFVSDELVNELNEGTKSIPGAAQWKKGSRFPLHAFTTEEQISGITQHLNDTPSNHEIYTTSGIRMSGSLQSLPKGLYIIREKGRKWLKAR